MLSRCFSPSVLESLSLKTHSPHRTWWCTSRMTTTKCIHLLQSVHFEKEAVITGYGTYSSPCKVGIAWKHTLEQTRTPLLHKYTARGALPFMFYCRLSHHDPSYQRRGVARPTQQSKREPNKHRGNARQQNRSKAWCRDTQMRAYVEGRGKRHKRGISAASMPMRCPQKKAQRPRFKLSHGWQECHC